MFLDIQGRRITYLRLSVTDACAMRCSYCRAVADVNSHAAAKLTVTEIDQLVRHLVTHHGLKKVRLTGGEPTNRPDLPAIIRRLATIPGLQDLAMTTNGLTLAHHAAEYAQAGLRRVNVSLDTLDARRFAEITGIDGLARVLAGLTAACEAGLVPVRINTVVVRGQNDGDLAALVRFAGSRGWDIRFIELMPMGPLADEWADRYVPEAEMRLRLDALIRHWRPLGQGHDAARRYEVELDNRHRATIGFITAMSCNFCSACNRIRIAADGTLYGCLMGEAAGSLLPALRPVFDAVEFDRRLSAGLRRKAAEHGQRGVVAMTHMGG